jgi:hypothetical protein
MDLNKKFTLRLWSLHPKYLDAKGLLALWRESLLAQKVLQGKTKGYRNHPQLNRFKSQTFPQKAIGSYLLAVWQEANRRGYAFDKKKIKNTGSKVISVTSGQIQYEWRHLHKKLRVRDSQKLKGFSKIKNPHLHPSFQKNIGPIEFWEKL